MGTLAYDPERLAQLAVALGDVADALGLLRSSDPEAAPALAATNAAGATLAAWRTRALEVAACGALTGYRPAAIDIGDLTLATEHVLAQLYGWRLASDPAGASGSVPPTMEAAALGHLISSGQVALDEPEQLATLRRRLDAVLADPAARAALAANLTADGVAALVGRLSERRAELVREGGGPAGVAVGVDPHAMAGIASVDAVVGAIANTVIDLRAPIADAQAWLAAMTPFGAGLVIARLDAPDHVIRLLAEDTMARALDPAGGPLPWEVPTLWQYGLGDVLFPRLATTSNATANRFAAHVLALDPELLLSTVATVESLTPLLYRATDPTLSAGAAGAVLVPLVTYLLDAPLPELSTAMHGEVARDVRGPLLAMSVPWMPHFTSRTAAWGWDDEEADAALTFVLGGTRRPADLEGILALSASDLPASIRDNEELYDALTAGANGLGELISLIEDRRLDIDTADRALWIALTDFLPSLAARAVSATGVVGQPAKWATRAISAALRRGASDVEGSGLPGVPDPLAEVTSDIALDAERAYALGAYGAVVVTVGLQIDQGAVRPDIAAPPHPPGPLDDVDDPAEHYRRQLDEWIDAALPADARGDARAALGLFIGAADATRRGQDRQNG